MMDCGLEIPKVMYYRYADTDVLQTSALGHSFHRLTNAKIAQHVLR